MVVLAESVVALEQAVIERQIRQGVLEKRSRLAIEKGENVLNCGRRRRNRAGIRVQAGQLSAEGIYDVIRRRRGLDELAGINHAFAIAQSGYGCRRRSGRRISVFIANAFVTGKPEELVFDDSSAGKRAKLLQKCGSHFRSECVSGVGFARIASECKGRAMQRVGTGLDSEVY